ncbi:MAG: rhodanese-like domain-containing protein [Gammaproteobacteria bacterium]|nr:rhodanese-like domain-containing protein [Gammaproteobacteria bacterium]
MMIKRVAIPVTLALAIAASPLVLAEKLAVKITDNLASVTVNHNGKKVTIKRDQNQKATVHKNFAKTSRKCPPFCIQPSTLATGVETIAEVEVLHYLKKVSDGDKSILVIDSRTPDWVKKGTIPGSINLPWTKLNPAKGADPISIGEIMTTKFGVKEMEGLWDYSNAKTLVMFCNGMWCGQSPNNIKNLLKFGYPADKIKWYRGGMQNWSNLGLTTIKVID